jgi:hypothetical protein
MVKIIIFLFIATSCLGQSSSKGYRIAELSLITLNVVDVYTTYKIINKGGYEMNPILGGSTNSMGRIILTKAAFIGGVLYFNKHVIHKDNPKLALANLILLNIGYSFAVKHNIEISLSFKI